MKKFLESGDHWVCRSYRWLRALTMELAEMLITAAFGYLILWWFLYGMSAP